MLDLIDEETLAACAARLTALAPAVASAPAALDGLDDLDAVSPARSPDQLDGLDDLDGVLRNPIVQGGRLAA